MMTGLTIKSQEAYILKELYSELFNDSNDEKDYRLAVYYINLYWKIIREELKMPIKRNILDYC